MPGKKGKTPRVPKGKATADSLGQRVAATGVLMDRTLRARALRTAAVSCE